MYYVQHKTKTVLIAVILIINNLFCLSQSDTTKYSFYGFHSHYGFIIPHSAAIRPVSGSKPFGVIADIGEMSTTFNSWKVFNTFWFYGTQTGFYSFQNNEVLGGAFILTGYAEPILIWGKRIILTARMGGGLSWHTKIYDEISNPANQFFCTRISFPIYVALRFRHSLTPVTYLTLSGFYNHISNGGLKQPNYGMNFPTVALGIKFLRKPLPMLKADFRSEVRISEPAFYISAGTLTSYKVVDKTDIYPEKGSLSWGIYARVMRQIKTFYSLNAGAELISDNAIKEVIRRGNSGIDHKRFALTAGQDFHMGRVIFTQYLGFYVYSPYKAKNAIYQKYELGYRINKNLITGLFLKAHTYEAELMGIQLSCLWKIKN